MSAQSTQPQPQPQPVSTTTVVETPPELYTVAAHYTFQNLKPLPQPKSIYLEHAGKLFVCALMNAGVMYVCIGKRRSYFA